MKEFKVDVSKCEIEDNPFTGSITIQIPNVKERQEFLKEMKIADASSISTDQGIDVMNKAADRIIAIDITAPEKISSVDDLTCYAEGNAIFQEICSYVLSGIPLGKTL